MTYSKSPLYLNDAFPFYRMYLDHYSIHSEETVCYCVDGSGAR